jgi:NagD protein
MIPHESNAMTQPIGHHKERNVKGRGFIIDMDGVIYRDSTPIPGAVEFINRLVAEQVPFTFVTNNSQRTRRDVCHKLNKMGMKVGENHVFTCAMATARFISEKKPNGTAYVIGEGGLLTALHMNGYSIVEQDPDFVIIGEGRTFSAESMEKAVNLVLGGASLIATNLDPNCPTKHGSRPGCGAMVSLLEKATGIQAFSVGKPSPVIMRMARKEIGLRTKSVTVIGDTMETDILGGVQMGYRTILVLSGGTKLESLPKFAYRPDRIVPSIANLLNEQLWNQEMGDVGESEEEERAHQKEGEEFGIMPKKAAA